MALPDSGKIVLGSPLVWSGSGFSPSDTDQPSGADGTLTFSGLASGSWRQGTKIDLGSANMDLEWMLRAWIEFHTAPDAGGTVDFYLAFSSVLTAGGNNPGNASGLDAAYNGYGAAAADADEAGPQLVRVGSLPVTNDADVQVKTVGYFEQEQRYAALIIKNNTSTAIANTDGVETGVAIYPRVLQTQD